ncbi:PhoD-like phosphatase-domain-containing protein [Dimargaris cristalligena]|uniref:PhoD-like phosphatase-domain-containing protein n=1 Tax=Dimargaris cristalligena TaxID=215637 RepID=A0A4P9ZPK6_9FUNG|nr:PhoD-like phosphatase-domain-containing protein [Dimargaris cristalligena]|eukprot:RKP35283.1 PhoD-like phosphatase-domain-containing protein [Dimargaris cristalligena]
MGSFISRLVVAFLKNITLFQVLVALEVGLVSTIVAHTYAIYFLLRRLPVAPITFIVRLLTGILAILWIVVAAVDTYRNYVTNSKPPEPKPKVKNPNLFEPPSPGAKLSSILTQKTVGGRSSNPPKGTSSPAHKLSLLPTINLILLIPSLLSLAAFYDFVYAPSALDLGRDVAFLKVGHFTATTAKVVIRDSQSPNLTLMIAVIGNSTLLEAPYYDELLNPSLTTTIASALGDSAMDSAHGLKWKRLFDVQPNSERDFTNMAEIRDLEPSTKYLVRAVRHLPGWSFHRELNRVGFRTAPPPVDRLNPQKAGVRFNFGSGSCMLPNFPYRPLQWSSIAGLRSITQHALEFFMFTGDFIYVDQPSTPLFTIEDFRRKFRQAYRSRDTTALHQRMPLYYSYDDHEYPANWDQRGTFLTENAITAYEEYNGLGNPAGPALGPLRMTIEYESPLPTGPY